MAVTPKSPDSNTNEPVAFDERTRRVMELRRQVREGRYCPDPETIARAILREWTDLGDELTKDEPPAAAAAGDRESAAAHFVVARTAPQGAEPGALTA
jgi:hypothetical protein